MVTTEADPALRPIGSLSPVQRMVAASWRTRTIGSLCLVFGLDLVILLRRVFMSDVSPFDEGYHLSYVQYMHDWTFPRVGDPMGRWSEELYACNNTYPFGQTTPVPCGTDGPSEAYPEGGRNTAASWPPLYYLIVGQAIRPMLALGMQPAIAGRMVSATFWAVGCVGLAILVLLASQSHILAISAGLLGAATPVTWSLASYVTPHSMAMLVGVGCLVLLCWAKTTGRRTATVAAVSAGAGVVFSLLLPHSIVGMSAVSVAGLSLAVSLRERRVRLLGFAFALTGAGVFTYFAWQKVVSLRISGQGPSQPSTPAEGLKYAIRDNWSNFWPRGIGDVLGLTGLEAQLSVLLMYSSIALVGFWVLSSQVTLQRGVSFGLVIAAPILSISFAQILDFPVPMRYGASLCALVLFLIALPKASRGIRVFVASLSALTCVVALLSSSHFFVMPPA